MSLVTRRKLLAGIGAAVGANAMARRAWAKPKFSDCAFVMDVEVPLTVGTVRTPEFQVKQKNYYIFVRMTSKDTPAGQDALPCLLGNSFRDEFYKCAGEAVLEGTWTVWDGANKTAEGSFGGDHGTGESGFERDLGQFRGRSKASFLVEVTFTKDGGPLKALKPHLIVRKEYDFWCGPF